MNIRAAMLRQYDVAKRQYWIHKTELRSGICYSAGAIAVGVSMLSLTSAGDTTESVPQFSETSVGVTKTTTNEVPRMSVGQPTAYEAPHVTKGDIVNELLFLGGATLIIFEFGVSAAEEYRRGRGGTDQLPEVTDSFILPDDERRSLEGIERVSYGYKD